MWQVKGNNLRHQRDNYANNAKKMSGEHMHTYFNELNDALKILW